MLKIFSVYDQKARAFLPPFFLPERAMAERVFTDCVNSDDHQFGRHPEDYTLIEIGTFDDKDGLLLPKDIPDTIGTGLQYKSPE